MFFAPVSVTNILAFSRVDLGASTLHVTVYPGSMKFRLVLVDEDTFPIHLIVLSISSICPTIVGGPYSISLTKIVLPLSIIVFFIIYPLALSVHQVIFELPNMQPPIIALESPLPMLHSVQEFPIVNTILQIELPFSFSHLFAILKTAFISLTVFTLDYSLARLLVIPPFPCIFASILIVMNPITMSFTLFVLSFISASIRKYEFALSIFEIIVFEDPFKVASVWESQFPFSIHLSYLELTFIDLAISCCPCPMSIQQPIKKFPGKCISIIISQLSITTDLALKPHSLIPIAYVVPGIAHYSKTMSLEVLDASFIL